MKKSILFFTVIFLSGCATYKFQPGRPPYDKGYVALRDDYAIPEYTIGKDNSVPDLVLAKERFKRRKHTVEHYYKRMGYIENRFKTIFYNPIIFSVKFIGGVFRLPFIVVSYYRYEHNPAYREKIDKLEAKMDIREEKRISGVKSQLKTYIQQDLAKEAQ